MGKMPLKHIENAYRYVTKDDDSHYIELNHGSADKLKDGTIVIVHYGTTIFEYNVQKDSKPKIKGWSATDREWINSMLYMMGIGDIKATTKGGYLHLEDC